MRHPTSRREFMTAAAMAIGGCFFTSRLALAETDGGSDARFIFVLLRGALDGLAAVPACSDPSYQALRGELTLGSLRSEPGAALPLDAMFGLHPSLQFLHETYIGRQLVIFHAIASPYRERSHFDGQDVLENGLTQAHASQTGWLNRALSSVQKDRRHPSPELGVALGQNIPLVMRGPAGVTSWSPSRMAALDDDTLDRIGDLYAQDPLLAKRLADALCAESMMGAATVRNNGLTVDPKNPAAGLTRYTEIVRATARFLRRDEGPRVAVFDTNGWDTHANEGSAQGQLATRLTALDVGLRTLKDELGPTWDHTVVLLATEFGRTAAVNGTRGTDHGTATVAFALGGAVQGGRVQTDWPGLSPPSLYQGRDLRPTSDLRSVLKTILGDHLRVSSRALESFVFPDSEHARPVRGLVRA